MARSRQRQRKTGRRSTREVDVASVDSREIENDQDEKQSFFTGLFSPEVDDTSGSSTDDMDSAGSSTHMSTISNSTDDSDSETLSTEGQERFDRELRSKHRAACKHMTGGRYGRAIKMFEDILSDLLDKYGEDHHRVGAALHNVAVANLRAGQLNDARDAIEEAVRIRKLSLGMQSPKVADSLVEYGIILLSKKQYEESLEVFREAFQVRQREAHISRNSDNSQEAQLKMAKIRHNIGCVNFELGQLEDAKEAYMEAIEQQKAAFGTWSTPFLIMTDTTKPGFLTMASTMCNRGYIELEQGNYKEGITVFQESLKIQRVLLEADNKLILSTLDNIGYSHCMLAEFEKGRKVFGEIVKLQEESYGLQSQKGWAVSVKKLIFCQVKLYEFEPAFDNLRRLEDYLSSKSTQTKTTMQDLERTHLLMGEVNYQIFKFPTLAEYGKRTFGCGMFADDRDCVDVDEWFPKKPANGSKMSGHRMTYA